MPDNVTISEDYRNLTVPQNEVVLGCVGDAWVRRVHFTAPRYCDGTDLSGYDYTVQFVNEGGVSDVYVVDDATASTDTVTFTWLVSPIACAVVGNTEVSIIASNVDAQTGDVLNRFVTTTFKWQVLPSTHFDDAELIEAESYVETKIAEWQAVVDTNTAAIAALSGIIPVSSFSSASTVKDYVDTSFEKLNNIISDNIFPNIIGCDYEYYDTIGDGIHFSTVCEHNGIYYGTFATGTSDGYTFLRKYDQENNSITKVGNAALYHTNSACYVDSVDKVYITGNTNHVLTFDSSFGYLSDITQPNNKNFWSISYDSATNKLYGMHDVNYQSGTGKISELNTSTLAIVETYDISFEVFDGYVLQDMAIDDGLAYISLPNGYFIICDFKQNKIIKNGHVSSINSTNYKWMAELEGWEFNSVGELVCAFSFTNANCAIGHTCKIFNKENIHQNDWYSLTSGVTLNETNLSKWYLSPSNIHCLTELGTIINPFNSVVIIEGTIPVSTHDYQTIFNDIELRIKASAILNTRQIRVQKGRLTLYIESGGTLNLKTVDGSGNTDGIRCDTYNNSALTLNNYGTITHDHAATKETIHLGYNKNPIVIGSLNSNTVTVDSTSRNAVQNSIYLGGAKVTASW